MCKRLALLSLHGCPVARLGEKDTGGMNVYLLQMAKRFARLGWRVDVFTRRHDPCDASVVSLEDGARVVHLDAGPQDTGKYDLVNYIPQFLAGLREFRQSQNVSYDLVHSHYWLSCAVGAALGREWGVPHVATFHTLALAKMKARAGESEPRIRQRIETDAARGADSLVVFTEEERDDLASLYGAPVHRIAIMPQGVDLERFSPVGKSAARRALGIGEDERVVLYVGRMDPLKGIDILLRALPLMECGDNARALIVGGSQRGDAERARLESLAAKLEVADATTFVGPVPQAELPAYYSAADVFVAPSHSESFGLAALEAMSCGTPVVASRVGGLKKTVSNGESGYLVAWRCPEAFAQRLDVLMANPALRAAMGAAARETALRMSWEAAAERLTEHYDALLADRSSPAAVAGG